MPVEIVVSSRGWSPALDKVGVRGLEDDVHDFLGVAGEAAGSGTGCGLWRVELLLGSDEPVEAWVSQLVQFLAAWGVPADTLVRVGLAEAVRVFPE